LATTIEHGASALHQDPFVKPPALAYLIEVFAAGFGWTCINIFREPQTWKMQASMQCMVQGYEDQRYAPAENYAWKMCPHNAPGPTGCPTARSPLLIASKFHAVCGNSVSLCVFVFDAVHAHSSFEEVAVCGKHKKNDN